jgi:YfiH family protein
MSADNSPVRGAFPDGPPFDRIVAAFTTRHLGKKSSSRDLDTGLHTGEDPMRVLENRKLVFGALGLDANSFTGGQQVHRDNVEKVTAERRGRGALSYKDAIPATDALITNVAGIPIGVFTADCVPIFLYDPERMAVGIVHAGWRSTALSITQKALQKMRADFGSNPRDMWAAIGPSIGQCCYEVGQDVFDEFAKFDYASALFKNTKKGKWHLDLWLANSRQLQDCGMSKEQIIQSRICSACNSHEYFSARKLRHRVGRTLSVIAIK